MYYKIKAAIKPLIKEVSLYKKIKAEIRKVLSADEKVVLALNLSRIWKYFKDKNFGTISAYKTTLAPEENKKAQEALKQDVRSKGYGYKEMKGVYRYADGTTGHEYSLFIPNIKKEDLIEIGNKYDQETVLYADPEKNKIVLDFIKENKTKEYDKMEIGLRKAWEAWTEFKNKQFSFVQAEWQFPMPPEVTSWGRGLYLQGYLSDTSTEDFDTHFSQDFLDE